MEGSKLHPHVCKALGTSLGLLRLLLPPSMRYPGEICFQYPEKKKKLIIIYSQIKKKHVKGAVIRKTSKIITQISIV